MVRVKPGGVAGLTAIEGRDAQAHQFFQTRVNQTRGGMKGVVELEMSFEQFRIVGEGAGHMAGRPVVGLGAVVQLPKIWGQGRNFGQIDTGHVSSSSLTRWRRKS